MNASDKEAAVEIAGYISIMSDVFLRLIKMLIGPLVFSTLVLGIAQVGDAGEVGRVFGKAMLWFMTASFLSLALGLAMANLLQPGQHLTLALPDVNASTSLQTSAFTLKGFVIHLVPRSFAEALATNEILQIVVFSLFFGVALEAKGNKAKSLIRLTDELAQAMLAITGYVMRLAPLAVMAATASTLAVHGLSILVTFAVFMRDFYTGLILLWALLIAAGAMFLGTIAGGVWITSIGQYSLAPPTLIHSGTPFRRLVLARSSRIRWVHG